jgi:hypothetical protein
VHKHKIEVKKMRNGRGGRCFGNYPGNGPFSNLPPWQRPGHLYGPGACMYLIEPVTPITPTPLTKEAETALLTQQKNAVELQVKALQQTLEKIQAKLDEKKQ